MNSSTDRLLQELHEAIIGSATKPGVLELIRDHERRISRIEALGSGALKAVWTPILAAITSAVLTFLAAHGIGKR